MTEILANTKIYKNFQTIIPKEIRDLYNIDNDTIIEWGVNDDGEPKIHFRKKVTLNDVAGIIKRENDVKGDWNTDEGVYLNE